jgi:hypothetical protein
MFLFQGIDLVRLIFQRKYTWIFINVVNEPRNVGEMLSIVNDFISLQEWHGMNNTFMLLLLCYVVCIVLCVLCCVLCCVCVCA